MLVFFLQVHALNWLVLGCQIGTGITGGDNFNAVLEPLNPGETYYVMVSGAAGRKKVLMILVLQIV